MNYTDTLKLLAPGKCGIAEIVHDTPSKFERLFGAMRGMPLTREKYCRLLLNGNLVMTDAEFERNTNLTPCLKAKGNSLVAGLGIGLILQPFIDSCSSVTVVEKSKDVIELVAPAFSKVTVIHADIFDWTPPKGTKYDTIYFDIWGDFSTDDNETAKQLHQRFRKYLAKGGYMESWCRIANRCVRTQ